MRFDFRAKLDAWKREAHHASLYYNNGTLTYDRDTGRVSAIYVPGILGKPEGKGLVERLVDVAMWVKLGGRAYSSEDKLKRQKS